MKFRSWALVPAVILSLSASLAATARAQAQPAFQGAGQALPGTRIALLDVNRILQSHARLKAAMEGLKQDVAVAEAEVKAKRDAINKLGATLQELNKGSPDYKAREEDLTRQQTEFNVQVKRQQEDFIQRRTRIYNDAYQEVLARTDYFCRQAGIDMVLQFNGEKVDPNDPNSVLRFINRPVVWSLPDLDITQRILDDLNRSSVPATTNRNNAVPGARQTVPFPR